MEKIKRYLIKYHSGERVVHWDGSQGGDVALCGADLAGDSGRYGCGWDVGVETRKKVDCEDCLKIIEHVKVIIKI